MNTRLKNTSNIIKAFMVRGPEYFYPNYYVDGRNFIERISIDSEEVQEIIDFTNNVEEYYENNFIDTNEFGNSMIKNRILTDLVEFEKCPDNEGVLRLFENISNCIIGNIEPMYKMILEIQENDEISEETIQEAEYNVYHSILTIFKTADALSKKYDSILDY